MSVNKVNSFPVLSFFSGGGFLDIGFEQAGFNLVWSNELDKDFVEFNRYGRAQWKKSNNLKDNQIINNQSITELSRGQILTEAFENKNKPHFGIIGGPPCQDFSLNGKMKGFSGDRGKLTIEFINKIKMLEPAFFLIENVPGLVRNQKNKEFYKELIKELEPVYLTSLQILNCLNFGVPQSRERLFTVGFRKDLIKEQSFAFEWPKPDKFEGALKLYNWPKQNQFGIHIEQPKDIPFELCVASCLIDDEDFDKVANSNEFFQLKTDLNKITLIKEGETNRPSFKRLHRYRYSPTTCYGNNEVHLHPYKNRRLSVREALRIQGVPDAYILKPDLSLSKKFKMIGNGVPVPLAKEMGTKIHNFLIKNMNVKY